MKEARTFIIAITLPAVVVAAGGARLLLYSWREMWREEQEALTMRSQLIADEVMERVHEEEVFKPGREPGPPHVSHHDSPERRKAIAAICDGVAERDTALVAGVAFAIVDFNSERIYSSSQWPSRPGLKGETRLGPPFPDCTLVAARSDGGIAMRRRAVATVAAGGSIALLLLAALVDGVLLFFRTLSRERKESRMKTDFIDNVSHELRTPLAGIRLTTELLVENRLPDEERRRGALQSILIEADRLERMVAELLDFSRLEKGTRRYALEDFDLAAFVDSPSELQAIAAISDGRARVTIKRGGVVVRADKDALRQIGVNLVTNAMKYSQGEIEIEVDGEHLLYKDRGKGIPAGCEEKIFERYYRVDNSLTRREGGSGLGLSIARGLARGMGGDLVYRHRDGGGSIFVFSLQKA